MENPTAEISQVIHLLTQSTPSIQRATLERYFTPNASFTHPFCRTGSFNGSRWLIWCIYRWYKIMSPRIELTVDSVAYDPITLTLYVSLHQLFRVWFVPFVSAPVSLTTVLRLVPTSSEPPYDKTTYRIQSQNDLYQVNEFVKFASLFGVLSAFLLIWQFVATGLCVVGATLGVPVSWVEENVVGGNRERSIKDAAVG
ncbi:hypothetical protein MMC20_003105 [Loxospora ochrophaea]|nr:hypothetical protein [Loxospora ochrophaea]